MKKHFRINHFSLIRCWSRGYGFYVIDTRLMYMSLNWAKHTGFYFITNEEDNEATYAARSWPNSWFGSMNWTRDI